MALTPLDIVNKEFDTKFRGFDKDQVNDYLDIIVAEFEALITENNQLKKELEDANDKIEYFNQLQDSLNNSIIVAQEAAERLKQNARKEAELILYEAERESNEMLEDASENARDIVTETDALRRSSANYRDELEKLIRQQLDLITKEEYINLFEGGDLESNLDPDDFKPAVEANRPAVSDQVDQLVEEVAASEVVVDEPVEADAPGLTPQVDLEEETSEIDLDSLNIDDFSVDAGEDSVDELDLTMQFNLDDDLLNQPQDDNFEDDIMGQTIRINLPDDFDK